MNCLTSLARLVESSEWLLYELIIFVDLKWLTEKMNSDPRANRLAIWRTRIVDSWQTHVDSSYAITDLKVALHAALRAIRPNEQLAREIPTNYTVHQKWTYS